MSAYNVSLIQNSMKNQQTMLKSASLTSADKVYKLLELLNVNNDTNLQLKVFSALSAHLMFNKGANIDIIIKCNTVYEKIQCVLSMGLSRKTSEALNFLSALLYCDTEDITSRKRALAVYARNMTRVSGCLSVMSEMFTSCMMYHDTWKALCQCTAIACSGCEINQSYCSHLIPVCIKKSSQENIDVLVVLQSLLLNHVRNVQLFLDCNGVSIFSRQLLHYDKCMHLLTTVVQSSKPSITLIQQTNVPADLQDFINLYGPGSQLGQKAIIILKHISSNLKEKEKSNKSVMHTNESLTDVTKTGLVNNDTNIYTNDLEETKDLIQNVMKEVFKIKQSERQNLNKNKSTFATNVGFRKPTKHYKTTLAQHSSSNKLKGINRMRQIQEVKNKLKAMKEYSRPLSTKNKHSFTFQENGHYQNSENGDMNSSRMFKPIQRQNNYLSQKNWDDTVSDVNWDINNTITPQDFVPVFASTPKHITFSTANSIARSTQISREEAKEKKFKELRLKRQKAKIKQMKEKNLNKRSLSSRFFSAINNSCTTLVKSVTNIFNKKQSVESVNESVYNSESNESIVKDIRPSSNSFMNYMKKRDAIISYNCTKKANNSVASSMADSCKTCNNTEVLKHKLSKDEFLKQTVRKLKLGINLYGCDFKKISKTMWPRESYMTPVVLYNLYRKLLLK